MSLIPLSFNDAQALDKRLYKLGYTHFAKPNSECSSISEAGIITLFSNGKLDDNIKEYQEEIKSRLSLWYRDYVIFPIVEKYTNKINHAIKAWTLQYNITRLGVLRGDVSHRELMDMRKSATIFITDDEGYGVDAELAGAYRAIEDFQKKGYNIRAENVGSKDYTSYTQFAIYIRFLV